MAFVYDGAKKGSDLMRKNSVTGLKKIKNTMRAAIQLIRMAGAGNETVNGEVWARRNRLEDEEPDSEEIEVEKPLDKHKIAFQQLIDADNHISSALMEKLTEKKENVFISAYSITSVLTLLCQCSQKGEQIDQLKRFLGINNLNENEFLAAQRELIDLLGVNTLAEGKSVNSKCIVETANAMYIDEKVKVAAEFESLSDTLLNTYQALVKYRKLSTIKTMNEINTWVNNKTHGMIQSILDKPMSEDMRMTLLNTIYFKAAWSDEFSEENTDKQIFYGERHDTFVDMMHQRETFDYAENEDYQVVRLSYCGCYEMTICLPKNTVAMDNWSKKIYFYIQELDDEWEWSRCEVVLSMPKFELQYEVVLSNVLTSLGLTEIFKNHIYDRLTNEGLEVASILHKTAIKNDEKGTEAAAVTMMDCFDGCCLPDKVVEMNIDHPFYFTISNTQTGLKLFEGCIYDL